MEILQDLRYGLRTLRKAPGFAALSILTLALGIGATAAVFSLIQTALLRALPYPDAQRLVFLFQPIPRFAGVPVEAFGPFNAEFYDWQQQSRSFTSLAMFTTDRMNLSTDRTAVQVNGSRVTGDFFRVLGLPPAFGHAIGPDDDQPEKGMVVVISHRLWQSRFGSDPGVLGKELLLDARPYRIVGVMPAGFAFPHGTESLETTGKATDVWVPWAMTLEQRASRQDSQGNTIGRLRPEISLAQAQAEMGTIIKRLDPLREPMFQGGQAVVRPFSVEIAGASRNVLLILLGAVLLVLLIACGNVAGLLLARANGRAMEMGVRAALGASRLRLLRQLLMESVCQAGAGGLLGIAIAFAAIRVLIRVHPANIPRVEETSLDGPVLLFAIGLSLGTVFLTGLLPAFAASRHSLGQRLKQSGHRVRRSRLQPGLLIGEVALAAVLLTASGLLIRSLLKLQTVDKGFDPASTVTMNIQLDQRYNQPERQAAFFRDLLERAAAVPGVTDVAAVNHLPLAGGESMGQLQVEGHPFDQKRLFEFRTVTPRYFAALGIPLLEGRAFANTDAAGHLRVVVISRSFARTYFANHQAVGKRLSLGGGNASWRTIVGVVADVRQRALDTPPLMQVYTPLWQTPVGSTSLVVHTNLPADRIAARCAH